MPDFERHVYEYTIRISILNVEGRVLEVYSLDSQCSILKGVFWE